MIKIYISNKAKQLNIDLFKKQFPNAEIIVKENYFVDDDMFIVDETILQPMSNDPKIDITLLITK